HHIQHYFPTRRSSDLSSITTFLPIKGVNESIEDTLILVLESMIYTFSTSNICRAFLWFKSADHGSLSISLLTFIIRSYSVVCFFSSNKIVLTFSKPKRSNQGAVRSA